jgi:hypothetical protein
MLSKIPEQKEELVKGSFREFAFRMCEFREAMSDPSYSFKQLCNGLKLITHFYMQMGLGDNGERLEITEEEQSNADLAYRSLVMEFKLRTGLEEIPGDDK